MLFKELHLLGYVVELKGLDALCLIPLGQVTLYSLSTGLTSQAHVPKTKKIIFNNYRTVCPCNYCLAFGFPGT